MRDPADWLLDEDALPTEAERAAFAELAPPEELLAATLAAMRDELTPMPEAAVEAPPLPAPANSHRWLWLGVVVAAAMALFTLNKPLQPGDPDKMTVRGGEIGGPEVALKMAARHAGKLERLRDGVAYAPGDALFFRAQTAGPGWIYLIRSSAEGVEVLDQRHLDAGEIDLDRGGQPLAWTLDHEDHLASFALLSSKDAREAGQLQAMLEERLNPEERADPDALCAAARPAGLGCDGTRVEVSP